jgi:hypothetical protein
MATQSPLAADESPIVAFGARRGIPTFGVRPSLEQFFIPKQPTAPPTVMIAEFLSVNIHLAIKTALKHTEDLMTIYRRSMN